MPSIDTWPNFFIVGAQKAGTTSLYHYLRQHPQVFMSPMKEPHYFSHDRVRLDRDLFITEENDYVRLFRAGAHFACIGEASPSYLWHPDVPLRIRQKSPNAKIIILLRDPVDRAYSQYLMDWLDGWSEPSFYRALQIQLAHPEKVYYGTGSGYIQLGEYDVSVRRYLEVFGRSQVLILNFFRFIQQSVESMARVANFLNIDEEIARRLPAGCKNYLPYRAPRNELVQHLMRLRRLRMVWRRVVSPGLRSFVRQSILTRSGQKPPLDRQSALLLQAIYEPQLVALDQLLDEPMPELRRTWQ